MSQIVRVPGDSATGTSINRNGSGTTWLPPNGTARNAQGGTIPQPRIEYVNNLKFDVDYTIQRMGRSGIKSVHLWVIRDQGNWQKVKDFPVNLMPGDKDQTLSLPFQADKEGLYGFYVIPESGAKVRAPDPLKTDQPMIHVEVDTTAPYIKVTGVRVTPGGLRGPLVEITWEVGDRNLMPQAVSLEYSLDKTAVQWKEIKTRLESSQTSEAGRFSGRYSWEVPDENLWKFWVRARAVDKAGNTGEDIWKEEVIVDLDKPAAGINGIRRGEKSSGGTIGTVRPAPETTTPPASLPPAAPVEPESKPIPVIPSVPARP